MDGQTEEVFQKHYPIEIDPIMSIDEKIPHMREWYETNHSMMLREGITRESITQAYSCVIAAFDCARARLTWPNYEIRGAL